MSDRQYPLIFIESFKGKMLLDVPMKDYTSIKIGGKADVMVFPRDEGDLREILSFARSKNFDVFFLGGGSNLLVRDGGIKGVVINMSEGFSGVEWESETKAIVGAGLSLGELARRARDKGLSGFEFGGGIPGTVGGGVWMNAGCYGREMKDVVEGIEVVTLKGKREYLTREMIGFGYRSSDLPGDSVIVRVHMRFEAGEKELVKERMKALKAKRRGTSAINIPNAGSVFKNPEGESAGKLIEEAGFKGFTVGDAQVSDVHANYIVNLGHATAKDVLTIIGKVRDKIYSVKGIVLELEIKVVGVD